MRNPRAARESKLANILLFTLSLIPFQIWNNFVVFIGLRISLKAMYLIIKFLKFSNQFSHFSIIFHLLLFYQNVYSSVPSCFLSTPKSWIIQIILEFPTKNVQKVLFNHIAFTKPCIKSDMHAQFLQNLNSVCYTYSGFQAIQLKLIVAVWINVDYDSLIEVIIPICFKS